MRRGTYSYVALALLSVAMGVLAIFVSFNHADSDGRKFCQLITGLTENAVPKPSNPEANPSREHNYQTYIAVVRLGKDLGC